MTIPLALADALAAALRHQEEERRSAEWCGEHYPGTRDHLTAVEALDDYTTQVATLRNKIAALEAM